MSDKQITNQEEDQNRLISYMSLFITSGFIMKDSNKHPHCAEGSRISIIINPHIPLGNLMTNGCLEYSPYLFSKVYKLQN